MKTKFKMAVAAVLATTALSANSSASKYISLGYAQADINTHSNNGITLDIGLKAGESFKNDFGMKFYLVGRNKDFTDTLGNIAEIHYSLGYEVLSSTILSARVGYMFKTVGSVGSGRSKSDIYSTGISYGAVATYELNEYFDIALSYVHSNMEADLGFGTSQSDTNIYDASLYIKF